MRIFRILPAWQATIYVAGGIALAAAAVRAVRRTRPISNALAGTPVVAAMSLALALGVSLCDFQSSPDFFVLLPLFGLGWALAVDHAARSAPRLALLLVVAIASAALLRASASRDQDLSLQKRHVTAVLDRYGSGAKIRVVGVPEWLVLTHRTQDDPFVFIVGGIDEYIDARRPGGFAAWLDKLKKESPDVIMCGPTHGALMQPYFAWLNAEYDARPLGTWTVHAKKPVAGAHVR